MKTLFGLWGLGAIALTGTIHFAQISEQDTGQKPSLMTAAAQVAAFEAKQITDVTVAASQGMPWAAPSTEMARAIAEKPKAQKAKAQKKVQKKSKKNRATAQKRKRKNPVLASFRKVDRFLKRAF